MARSRSGTSRPPRRTSRSRWRPHRPAPDGSATEGGRAGRPPSRGRRRPRHQGRHLHLAPQVHRRPGHARRPRRPPRAVPQPRPDRARRRHGRLRQPDRARLPRRHRAPRGGRHAGHRRVDPRRPRLPAQGGGRGGGDPRARGGLHRPGHRALAGEPGHRDPGQPRRSPRLSIVSFVVRRRGRYLHHNFVVALLNDLFGIQARGGCSCAGPYGHRLLGIDLERSHEFEREIARGCEGIKPGWVRVNFNYFISEAVFAYILDAVDLVARDGWRLLPQYRFEPPTGLWQHRGGARRAAALAPRRPLRGRRHALPGPPPPRAETRLADYLAEARALLAAPPPSPGRGRRGRSTSTPTSSTCAGSGSRPRRRRSSRRRRGAPTAVPALRGSGRSGMMYRSSTIGRRAAGCSVLIALVELVLAAGFWLILGSRARGRRRDAGDRRHPGRRRRRAASSRACSGCGAPRRRIGSAPPAWPAPARSWAWGRRG